MAFALDAPLYLTLSHLPWPVYPAWLLPTLLLGCTSSGLLAVWARWGSHAAAGGSWERWA
jgi:hypothetical protein